MNYRTLALLPVCVALAALAACEPKPQPPKAAMLSPAASAPVTADLAGTSGSL
jgi:hypothetical protein